MHSVVLINCNVFRNVTCARQISEQVAEPRPSPPPSAADSEISVDPTQTSPFSPHRGLCSLPPRPSDLDLGFGLPPKLKPREEVGSHLQQLPSSPRVEAKSAPSHTLKRAKNADSEKGTEDNEVMSKKVCQGTKDKGHEICSSTVTSVEKAGNHDRAKEIYKDRTNNAELLTSSEATSKDRSRGAVGKDGETTVVVTGARASTRKRRL